MDSHPDIIFIKDRQFRYRYTNESFIEISKITGINNVLGSVSEDFVGKDRAKLFQQTDEQVIREGKTIEYVDKVTGSEEIFYAMVIKSPIYNKNGDIIGIYGHSRDASDLIQARDLVETILNTIPYPVFIKNLDLEYIRVNDAYARELRKPKEEIINKNDYELFETKDNEFYRSKDRQVIATGDQVMYISSSVYDNKKFMTIKKPLYDHQGKIIGVVGIVNLYLDLEEIQNELLNQQKIESLSILAGGIAHDLNNILTSVMGLSSILLEEMEQSEHKKMVETIHTSSINAAKLIEKLLTFSKQTPHDFDEIELLELISQVTDLIKSSYSAELSIVTETCCDSVVIYADQTQISQMFMNFIINAAEAMDFDGIVHISIRKKYIEPSQTDYVIMSKTAKPGEYVSITISDQGPGIDTEILSSIFDPYFSTKEYGTGLGLSIVYGALTANNGLLKLETSDQGTTFEVCLPLNYSSANT